jgi:LPXTG-motif cell wall-anchored protein
MGLGNPYTARGINPYTVGGGSEGTLTQRAASLASVTGITLAQATAIVNDNPNETFNNLSNRVFAGFTPTGNAPPVPGYQTPLTTSQSTSPATATPSDNKTLFIVGGSVIALGGIVYLLKKRRS